MKKGYNNSKRNSRSTPTSPINSPISTPKNRNTEQAAGYFLRSSSPTFSIIEDAHQRAHTTQSSSDDYVLQDLKEDLSLPPKLDPENIHNMIHKICDNVSTAIQIKETKRNNLVQMILEEMIKIKLHSTSFFGHLQVLRGRISQLESTTSTILPPPPEHNYAEILQSTAKEKIIIVENKTETEKTIQEMLSGKDLKAVPKPIDIIPLKKKKKFLIKHSNATQATEYYDNIKGLNSAEIHITIETPKNNKIILYHIPDQITEEELQEELKTDDALKHSDFEIIRSFKSKENSKHYVIAVDNETNKKLLRRERILIKYNSFRLKKYTVVKRCFRCQGFNHYSTNCNRPEKCGKCSGAHDTRSCTSSILKCANCFNSHASFSNNCPKYRDFKNQILKRSN